jgi:hypothetical protein
MRMKTQAQWLTYLVQGHAEEEQHHVDDFVHYNFTLEADEEEHPPADVDPVLDKHGHHQLAQHLHDVLVIVLHLLFLQLPYFLLLFLRFLVLLLLSGPSFLWNILKLFIFKIENVPLGAV